MASVIVRVTAKPNGTKEYKVLRHDGTTCAAANDPETLKRLMEQQVAGFGGGGEVEDSGKTSEFFEANKGKGVRPHTEVAPGGDGGGGGEEEEEESTGRRRLDLGFGT